jgi:hypothetical protein
MLSQQQPDRPTCGSNLAAARCMVADRVVRQRGSLGGRWLVARALAMTAVALAATACAKQGSSAVTGHTAGNSSAGVSSQSAPSTSVPSLTTTPPTGAPPTSNPASPGTTASGADLPYTVVATDGPFIGNGVVAATDMSKLLTLLNVSTHSRLNQICPPGGCFTRARPPDQSLLIVFNAVSGSCQTPTSYAARLTDPQTLRIDVSASDACPTGGAGALAEAPDVLLAIPLERLPATGQLTVAVYPYGSGFGGQPETGNATLR